VVKHLAITLVLVAGCKWTDFDDLSNSTWVKSTEKPTNDASDYGIAIARGLRVGSSGGTLVALGTGQALYTELVYDASGNSSLSSNEVKLNNDFAIASLVDQPLLLADPESDDVSLVVASGGNSIAVLTGTGMLNVQQVFNQNSPDGATYIKFDAAQQTQPIVGAGTTVFGVDTTATQMQHTCTLTDATAQPIQIAALGAGKIDATDTTEKLVVWTKTGQLLVYDSTVWNGTTAGCSGTAPILAAVDTGFMPGTGAEVFTIKDNTDADTTFVVLAGRQAGTGGGPNGQGARIVMYDLSGVMPTIVGAPLDRPGLHGMAVASFDNGNTQFFIAGFPNDSDGTVDGGDVLVFPLSTTTGVNPSSVITLSDAQPDSGQSFGRAVTAMPFNGKTALVVAANNEIYAYVRCDPLYTDLRQ
jgi:hypothetical protein